jgi:hypothetical protein
MVFSSPPLTKADRDTLLLRGVRMNPFNRFLLTVVPVMRVAQMPAAQQAIEPARYEAFTANAEERNFSHDIVDRVEHLSYCFDRLCELGLQHFQIQEAKAQNQSHPNAIDVSKVPPSVLTQEEKWKQELHILTAFVFYEVKSLCDMLRTWAITINGEELRFLTKSRDRFLAHPRLGGVMRLAHRSYGVPYDGRPVEASVAGLNSFEPITRTHYLSLLGLDPNTPVLDEGQRRANEECVVSRQQNHQLDAMDVIRLKAFGLRDPNLVLALEELAEILEGQGLPKIKECFEIALRDFRFVRY